MGGMGGMVCVGCVGSHLVVARVETVLGGDGLDQLVSVVGFGIDRVELLCGLWEGVLGGRVRWERG